MILSVMNTNNMMTKKKYVDYICTNSKSMDADQIWPRYH